MRAFTTAEFVKNELESRGITDEVIEAVARAMYENDEVIVAEGEALPPTPWDAISDSFRGSYREAARTALYAALRVWPVSLCDTCTSLKVCFFRFFTQFSDWLAGGQISPMGIQVCVTKCDQYKPDPKVSEVLHDGR